MVGKQGGINMFENTLSYLNGNDSLDVEAFLNYLQDEGIIEIKNIQRLPYVLDDWSDEEA